MQKILDKEIKKVLKKEMQFLKRNSKNNQTKLDIYLEEKIPEQLQLTLNKAFMKSFQIVFDKGTKLIDKSYNKEELIYKEKCNAFSFGLKPDKKRIRAFKKTADQIGNKNVAISAVKGMSLGLLGIGVPDIPVFLGLLLKSIYEIALSYGYQYDTEKERAFILMLIATSLSHEEKLIEGNSKINDFILTSNIPVDFDSLHQLEEVSDGLAAECITMKFLQGLPIIGVVGGLADAVFTRKILSYAKIKYQHRFLIDKSKMR